jgi:uncharacterized membrane protein
LTLMSTLSPTAETGRLSAIIVYALFLLSIPSAAILALVGVILALAARDGAGPLARSHLDDQIRIWFIAFWWAVGLAVLAVIGWVLTVVLVGFIILWVAGILGLCVMIWFTLKSFLGLLALLDDRPR